MRRILFTLALLAAASASAQPLPKLEPLPEPPPPPPGLRDIDADEPRVRIPAGEADKVDVINRGSSGPAMVRVTPPGGAPPYYLYDTTGNGNWVRRDSLDDGVRVPMWTLRSFD